MSNEIKLSQVVYEYMYKKSIGLRKKIAETTIVRFLEKVSQNS